MDSVCKHKARSYWLHRLRDSFTRFKFQKVEENHAHPLFAGIPLLNWQAPLAVPMRSLISVKASEYGVLGYTRSLG
jgi:hypothetical protein